MRKIIARAMRKEAEKEFNDLYQISNGVFYFLKKWKRKGRKEEGA